MNIGKWRLCAGALAMGAMGFAAGACAAQKPPSLPDPMEAVLRAPKNHKVLYEDTDIRFLEVTVLPGETENLHDHPWSSVFIVDRPQPLRRNHKADGSARTLSRSLPGVSYPSLGLAGPEGAHQVENLDTYAMHFYRLEFKRMNFPDGENPKAMDSLP